MAFDFYQEIHRTRTFSQKLQQADSLDKVFCPLDQQSSHFPTFWSHIYSNRVFLKYAKSHSNVIALYVGLGKWKRFCIYGHRCFEHSMVKPLRIYVVIGVTDVKDYTSNNITRDLSLRLRTHSRWFFIKMAHMLGPNLLGTFSMQKNMLDLELF